MKQCKEADEQWLQEKRDNFATAMSYVSVPANQLNPNLQPQSQQPQIVNYPSYTIRQTGYNTYKAEPDGFTVLPAPAGTSSYRQ